MLNLLYGYIENSLPESGAFQTRPGLRAKVDDKGQLLPFTGNTTVFLLDDGAKAALSALQDSLYAAAGDMLAERLAPETFHMTLHDLANGAPGPDTEGWMADTEAKARVILEQLKEASAAPLNMKATRMFNMVSTSIVLGLAPADQGSYDRLSYMYGRLNEVVPLDYALTPHITLAYYLPGCYTRQDTARLRSALEPVHLELRLEMKDLVLQQFSDMNHYVTI